MTKEVENQVEDQEVDETLDKSPASETLHPGAGANAGTMSRTHVLASIAGAIANVDRDTANYWEKVLKDNFKSEFGTNSGEWESNKNSIRAWASKAIGKSVKEDVAEMFNGQELSEEFKNSASVLFEAAVNAKVNMVLAEAEDLYEERLQEEIGEISDALEDKTAQFLQYVAEQWMEQNEVAIESTLRSEITTDFMSKLRDLFTESNVNIPDEQTDVIDALANRVEELEAHLSEAIQENAELREGQEEITRESIIAQAVDGLTQLDAEKVTKLAESLEAEDADDFIEKVGVLVESVKPGSKTNKNTVQELLEEADPDNQVLLNQNGDVLTEDNVPAEMAGYLNALKRTMPPKEKAAS